MTAHEQTTVAALDTQAFALMGRLHVILRRQSGRVTDIEYMRIDPQYCRYLLGIASQVGSDDMQHICERLREIYFGPDGLFVREPLKPPLVERFGTPDRDPVSTAATSPAATGATGASDTTRQPAAVGQPDDIDRAYIGRLR